MSAGRAASDADAALLGEARRRSIELLRANLTPAGILAASPSKRAETRGYTAIFGRDAAVCAIGMALSGDEVLEERAAVGLETLAAHQAANGQVPKFVDVRRREADFWYLGCIDATLWWLIGLDCVDRIRGTRTLARRNAKGIRAALAWLGAQEHQRFFLLQQNEASDWADIMPRSGFVLYTNALWHHVKRRFGLPHAARRTRASTRCSIRSPRRWPSTAARGCSRSTRRTKARNRGLYLSFVNFSFFGDEGDVFGNLLALLLGLADETATARTLRALKRASVDTPYPVRVTVEPIEEASFLWRPYMSRHEQNFAWQYHNGGIWPFVGGLLGRGARAGRADPGGAGGARRLRPRECAAGLAFFRMAARQTHACEGMAGQSWNAAAWLMADAAVSKGVRPFDP